MRLDENDLSCSCRWTEDDDVDEDSKSRKIIPKPSDYSSTDAENPFQQKYLKAMSTKMEGGQGCKKGQEAPRKRRARCQACPGCLGTDCQECAPCRQDFESFLYSCKQIEKAFHQCGEFHLQEVSRFFLMPSLAASNKFHRC